MVKSRKTKSKRRRLDDYETPASATLALIKNTTLFGPILEPAAGSGRMAKVFRQKTRKKVTTADLKRGQDFLKRTKLWPGSIVTNPPYRDDLPEAFARKALALADGNVALLVEGKWLWGSKRAAGLFKSYKPSLVIVLSSRIYFHEGSGPPIKSQFFSHCWVVWPQRALRQLPLGRTTRLVIVDQNELGK